MRQVAHCGHTREKVSTTFSFMCVASEIKRKNGSNNSAGSSLSRIHSSNWFIFSCFHTPPSRKYSVLSIRAAWDVSRHVAFAISGTNDARTSACNISIEFCIQTWLFNDFVCCYESISCWVLSKSLKMLRVFVLSSKLTQLQHIF